MTAEYQTEIKKSDEKWHAGHEARIAGGVAAFFAGGSLLVPDPQLKKDFAAIALLVESFGGVFLVGDAMVGSARIKLKEATGK